MRHMQMRCKNSESGVSLVELVVVLAIITILGYLSAPALLDYVPKYRANSAAKALMNEILNVRSRAIATNTRHKVVFDADNNKIVVTTVNSAGAKIADVSTIQLGSTATNKSYSYVSLGRNTTVAVPESPNSSTSLAAAFGADGVDNVTFYSNGTANMSGEFFVITTQNLGHSDTLTDDRTFCIQVTIGGLTRLSGYNPSASSGEKKWKDF